MTYLNEGYSSDLLIILEYVTMMYTVISRREIIFDGRYEPNSVIGLKHAYRYWHANTEYQ